jgi:hypothetical protein
VSVGRLAWRFDFGPGLPCCALRLFGFSIFCAALVSRPPAPFRPWRCALRACARQPVPRKPKPGNPYPGNRNPVTLTPKAFRRLGFAQDPARVSVVGPVRDAACVGVVAASSCPSLASSTRRVPCGPGPVNSGPLLRACGLRLSRPKLTGPGPHGLQASPTRARDPKPKTGPGCRLRRAFAGAWGPAGPGSRRSGCRMSRAGRVRFPLPVDTPRGYGCFMVGTDRPYFGRSVPTMKIVTRSGVSQAPPSDGFASRGRAEGQVGAMASTTMAATRNRWPQHTLSPRMSTP